MAQWEAGRPYKMNDEQWQAAQRLAFNGQLSPNQAVVSRANTAIAKAPVGSAVDQARMAFMQPNDQVASQQLAGQPPRSMQEITQSASEALKKLNAGMPSGRLTTAQEAPIAATPAAQRVMYGIPGLGGAFWKPEEAQAYAKAHGFDQFERIDTGVGPYGKYNQAAVNAALMAKMKEQGVDPANAGLLAFSAGGYAANKLPADLRSKLGHVAIIGSPGVNESAFRGSQGVVVNPTHDLKLLQQYMPQQTEQTSAQPSVSTASLPQVNTPEAGIGQFDPSLMGALRSGKVKDINSGVEFLRSLARSPQAKVEMWHPEFQKRFENAARAAYAATGHYPQLPYANSAGRTYQDQAEIYRRSGGGRAFAAAPPGRSNHEANYEGKAAAADLVDNPARAWIRQHARQFGLKTLGGTYDMPHIEIDRNWRGQ
jgi:hypothetical protein